MLSYVVIYEGVKICVCVSVYEMQLVRIGQLITS